MKKNLLALENDIFFDYQFAFSAMNMSGIDRLKMIDGLKDYRSEIKQLGTEHTVIIEKINKNKMLSEKEKQRIKDINLRVRELYNYDPYLDTKNPRMDAIKKATFDEWIAEQKIILRQWEE
tara:strand:+ start:537 stop:899 length:363 start_codon:yes stop_codon:yes gene_type:complete